MVQWHDHQNLQDAHAFLTPSSPSWLNYDKRKLAESYDNARLKERGTALHAFAQLAITEGIKTANHKKALNQFINDAIGYGMRSEMILMYDENCFGTADAIKFDEKEQYLRIHDLKTGLHRPPFTQLYVYCALFCLEYNKDPYNIGMECRIYQGSGFEVSMADPDDIVEIMSTIVESSSVIKSLKNKGV